MYAFLKVYQFFYIKLKSTRKMLYNRFNEVIKMKEFQKFDRIGTTPHRSYYIPFAENDIVRTKHGILDRTSSSRFTSLDGVWQIKQLDHVEDFAVNFSEDYNHLQR